MFRENITMKIQHNQSLFVQNRYNHTTTELNKTLNKLSSGYKVNQAADDAAGLSISEKMRAQIRGLEQAGENIAHGISFVQTADAGLAEIHNPNLVRLRELAIQAANDTMTDADRLLIQAEVTQIIQGIDDIANNTEFNTIHPLRHNQIAGINEIPMGGQYLANKYLTIAVDANGGLSLRTNQGFPNTVDDDNQTLIYQSEAMSQPSVLIDGQNFKIKEHTKQLTKLDNDVLRTSFQVDDMEIIQEARLIENQFEFTYEIINRGNAPKSTGFYFHMDTKLGNDDGAPFMVDNVIIKNEKVYTNGAILENFDIFNNAGNPNLKAQGQLTGDGILLAPDQFIIGNYSKIMDPKHVMTNDVISDSGYALKWNERELQPGESLKVNTRYGIALPPSTSEESKWTPSTVDPDFLILQVGPNEGHHLKVQLTDARSAALGINNLDLTTQEKANNALASIDSAVAYVSDERSKYGGYQNALAHIANYVGNAAENLAASESSIRDTDMAEQTSQLVKHQVLLQSAQAMMAQVNQMSQGILQILQ